MDKANDFSATQGFQLAAPKIRAGIGRVARQNPLTAVSNTVRPEFCYRPPVIVVFEHMCCQFEQRTG
jgi:hypothetical protein